MADERAMRFGFLLSEVQLAVREILAGNTTDIMLDLAKMAVNLGEATKIAAETSREALEKVGGELLTQTSGTLSCPLCSRPILGRTGLEELHNLIAHMAEHHDETLGIEEAIEERLAWEKKGLRK